MRRRHHTFQFSVFTFQFVCVADTIPFSFQFSVFSLICVADTTLFSFPFSPFSLYIAVPLPVGIRVDNGALVANGLESLVRLIHIISVARIGVAQAVGYDAGVVA